MPYTCFHAIVCFDDNLAPNDTHPHPSIAQTRKPQVYLKGFYEGVMLVGPCAGEKVCDAKAKIRQELMDRGEAMPYFEPESLVVSRCDAAAVAEAAAAAVACWCW